MCWPQAHKAQGCLASAVFDRLLARIFGIQVEHGTIWTGKSPWHLDADCDGFMIEFTSDFAFFHPKKSEKSVCGKRRRHYAGLAQGPCQAFGREAQLQFQGKFQPLPNGGFLSHRGTPSHHPFLLGFSFIINHQLYGVPFQETSKWYQMISPQKSRCSTKIVHRLMFPIFPPLRGAVQP